MKSNYRYLYLALCLSFSFRIVFLLMMSPWDNQVESSIILHADAKGYHQLAETLLNHQRFSYSSTGDLNTLRTPLYPIFIAASYFVFGIHPWVVLFLQALIDTLSCFILWLSIDRLFDRKTAYIAALFYALDPFMILYSTSLASDTLFVFILILSFFFFSYAINPKPKTSVLIYYSIASILLGIATLVRPLSQYIMAFIVVFILFAYRNQIKKAFAISLISCLLFLAAISPWLVRNYNNFGEISLASVGSYALLILYVKPLVMDQTGLDTLAAKKYLVNEANELAISNGQIPENLNDFQKSKYQKSIAIKYIKQHPIKFVEYFCIGMLHTFSNIATSEFARKLQLPVDMLDVDMKSTLNLKSVITSFFHSKSPNSLLIASVVLSYMIISYICLLSGSMIFFKQQNTIPYIFCAGLAFYFIFITGTTGIARYKLPAIPFYLPFVSIGFQWLYNKTRSFKQSTL